jgi:hypothetical protein
LAVCDGRNVVCNYYVVHYQQLEAQMSWVARKLTGDDYLDQQQVIKEYFEHKEQAKQLQEKQLMEFWKEYEQDERGA